MILESLCAIILKVIAMNKRIFLSALAAVLMLSGCGTDIEKIDVKKVSQTDSSSEELFDSSIAE